MEVHIISLLYDNKYLTTLHEILSQAGDEIKFTIVENFMPEKLLNMLAPNLQNAENEKLRFEDLFGICSIYRNSRNIQDEIYVVFISPFANSDDWFSAVNGEDIFIYPKSWENIVNILPDQEIYATAYNIIVNLFQSLLEITYKNYENHPNIIHMVSIGCLNDFCKRRAEYIIKLRTGYICDRCIEAANEKNISNDIIIQLYLTIKHIRKKFMNFDRIVEVFEPEKLTITSDGDIIVGSKTLKLPALQKTIYILFINHLDGIDARKLQSDYLEELKKIYSLFRNRNFTNPIENLRYPNFQYHKSCLNKSLKYQIGKYKSENYIIKNFHSNGKYRFKISLNEDKIDDQRE